MEEDLLNAAQEQEIQRIRRLASFPESNPNPVLEMDSSGKVTYYNSSTIETLKKLGVEEIALFLPKDLSGILKAAKEDGVKSFYREVEIEDEIFAEDIYFEEGLDVFRVYVRNITAYKKAEELILNTLEESQRRQREISALLEGSHAVLKYHDFKGAARAIFNSCKNLLGATSGYIALLSKDGSENEVLFLDSGRLPCKVDPSLPMPIRGMRAEAYRNVKAIYHNNFLESEWAKFLPNGHVPLNNVLFAPLIVDDKAVGLLGLGNKPGGFTENDVRIAKAFAELASIALVQKRAEEAVRASEEYFRLLTENALDIFAVLEVDGTVRYVSPSIEGVLGYKREEVIGGSPLKNVHPDDLPDIVQTLTHLAQHPGSTQFVQLRYRHKDGSWRILEAAGKNLLNDRVVNGIVINSRDITESKQAEVSLRYEKEKLANILDTMVDGVYIVNEQQDIEYINPALEREFGPVQGRKCYEYFHDRKAKCPWCKNEIVFGGKIIQWEWYSPKTQKTYDLIDTPLKNSDGSISKLEIFRDITERKESEEKLKKMTEELERSNADLQQFAYVASHDLQAPLRNVEGFIKLFEKRYRGKLDERADEYIKFITDGTRNMQALIKDLLEYSQVGAKSKKFKNIDCSLSVARALANLKETIDESEARVTYDEPLPRVKGDSSQLDRLFQNLIENAIKFRGDKPPEICISAEQRRNEWVFSVRDNGIGIDPDHSERIFAIFQRLHSRDEYEGTGIGLSICKKVVEHHGGRIWVDSEPGKGSTFYFTLPVQSEK
ncbi:MAG: ATP-binding protein [Nitrospirota bacterium]